MHVLCCDDVCMLLQYSVLLMVVFILEAGSGVLTYLYEIKVSSTLSMVCCYITVACWGCME